MDEKSKSMQYKEFKIEKFQKISENSSQMFNFFFENNDVFRFIDPKDQMYLKMRFVEHRQRTFNAFFGTLAAVFAIDKIVLRLLAPNFRINRFRGSIFMMKWFGLPFLAYGMTFLFLNDDIQEDFFTIAQKYNFGYEDFNKATKIWDRAQKVGRLEELFEKRGDFDWTGIPELEDNKYRV